MQSSGKQMVCCVWSCVNVTCCTLWVLGRNQTALPCTLLPKMHCVCAKFYYITPPKPDNVVMSILDSDVIYTVGHQVEIKSNISARLFAPVKYWAGICLIWVTGTRNGLVAPGQQWFLMHLDRKTNKNLIIFRDVFPSHSLMLIFC